MEYSMIPEIGHFALILALGVSIIQGVLPLIGAQQGRREWLVLARPATQISFVLLAISFGILAWCFKSFVACARAESRVICLMTDKMLAII